MDVKESRYNLQKMRAMLYNFASMLMSNSEEAYHLVQDTFAMSIDKQSALTDAERKKDLLRTMRNLYIYNYKSVPRDSSPKSGIPAIGSKATAGIDDIRQGMKLIPNDQKRIYSMYISGYGVSDISRKLNLPGDKIEMAVCQASRLIEKHLRNCG